MARILCVEDEADFRDSLVDFLSAEGHEVISAKDGKEGFYTLSDQPFDLVVSDIGMPEMTGLELLREFRAQHPEQASIPFIFLTAFGQKKDLIRGRSLGVDDYLIKPVDFDLLGAAVTAKLERMSGLKFIIDHELDGMRGQLVHMLSEELHGPLNTILTFSDMMSSEALGPLVNDRYREFVSNIRRSGYDLMSLVNNCLDTASLLAQHQEPVRQNIDLDGLAWECLQAVRGQGVQAVTDISQRIEPNLPLLEGDYNLIARMLVSVLHAMASYHVSGHAALEFHIYQDRSGEVVLAFRDRSLLSGERDAELKNVSLTDPKQLLQEGYRCFLDPGSSTMRFVQVVMEQHGGSVWGKRIDKDIPVLELRFPVAMAAAA